MLRDASQPSLRRLRLLWQRGRAKQDLPMLQRVRAIPASGRPENRTDGTGRLWARELWIFGRFDRRPIMTPPISLRPHVLQRPVIVLTGVKVGRRFTPIRERTLPGSDYAAGGTANSSRHFAVPAASELPDLARLRPGISAAAFRVGAGPA